MIKQYYHLKSRKTVLMRPVNLEEDLLRLYSWVHQPHTIPHWQLNFPLPQLYDHFKKALSDNHQSLFMVSVDGQDLCYAETYNAVDDMLASYCNVLTGDYGLHLLIGPPKAIGQGNSEPILCALTDYLFTYHKAKRVLVEPDYRVKQLTILERKLGYKNLGRIQLPNKEATLYAAEPSNFYAIYPSQIQTLSLKKTRIVCDVVDWPLIKIHFPSEPSDEVVIDWLEDMDLILSLASPCVVISTFSPHYQFKPSARRKQAIWFKKNREKLADYCLGMVRVTNDKAMIEKITSNAMREGMPFICIPAENMHQAEHIGKHLLNNIGIF